MLLPESKVALFPTFGARAAPMLSWAAFSVDFKRLARTVSLHTIGIGRTVFYCDSTCTLHPPVHLLLGVGLVPHWN